MRRFGDTAAGFPAWAHHPPGCLPGGKSPHKSRCVSMWPPGVVPAQPGCNIRASGHTHMAADLILPSVCDVLSLFGSFWTVSVRIGALAQYGFLYGLIYRIFLVFLGLFPVGFRLFG
jgi:hypothetical protein